MFGHQDESKNNQTGTADEPAETMTTTKPSPVVSPAITTPLHASDDKSDATSGSGVSLPAPGSSTAPSTAKTVGSDSLLDIKQQALQHLTPLVGHLQQSPEEKFRTTMMMIQAADNQDLIQTAYEAAQSIADEKARAQALLDIVNEINYFTQHSK